MNEVVEGVIRGHLARGDQQAAATEAIRAYGPRVLGYLRGVLRDEQAAADVFSEFSEHLWRGLAHFRGESSFLTWSYGVAWGSVRRFYGDPYRKRKRALETGEASRLADEIRSTTAMHLKTAVKDEIARLRESLTVEEQTLLALRVDRDLAWKDIAEILAEPGAPAEEAALRKRFERVKSKLRKLAAEAGLLKR